MTIPAIIKKSEEFFFPQLLSETLAPKIIIAALSFKGAQVRLIGGCVRDKIAGRPIKDIDIATTDTPEIILKLLKKAKIKVSLKGIKYGTITAILPGQNFDITTLRIDKNPDGRYASVVYTDSWITDAARRDFTFNALSATPDGDVYDYFDGLSDLKKGIVRFIGNPDERVIEDHLRILRYFRFLSEFGGTPIHNDSFDACRQHANKIALLSGERVRDEFFKIIEGPQPTKIISMMHRAGVLQNILPEIYKITSLHLITEIETLLTKNQLVRKDSLRRLGALIIGADKPNIKAVGNKLKLSTRQVKRLNEMSNPISAINQKGLISQVLKALTQMDREIVCDKIIIAWVKQLSNYQSTPETHQLDWIALVNIATSSPKIEFPLKGRDAIALGIPEGPHIRKFLDTVKIWWENGGFKASHNECLMQLKKLSTKQ